MSSRENDRNCAVCKGTGEQIVYTMMDGEDIVKDCHECGGSGTVSPLHHYERDSDEEYDRRMTE